MMINKNIIFEETSTEKEIDELNKRQINARPSILQNSEDTITTKRMLERIETIKRQTDRQLMMLQLGMLENEIETLEQGTKEEIIKAKVKDYMTIVMREHNRIIGNRIRQIEYETQRILTQQEKKIIIPSIFFSKAISDNKEKRK